MTIIRTNIWLEGGEEALLAHAQGNPILDSSSESQPAGKVGYG